MKTRSPLISALQRATSHGMPSLFQIDGCGSVSVYPQQHCYVTDIQDWDAAYHSDSGQFTIKSVPWGMPPSGALPLIDLHWRAAYHCALRDQSANVQANDLVRLRSWPNLSRLPVELVAPVTQICALLWRKPAVGFLIPRVLEADSAQVGALLDVLQGFGHITVSKTVMNPQLVATPDSVLDSQTAVDAGEAPPARRTDTLAGKLWRRLIGH